ncbi:MAG: hypothetical protein JNK45_02455 [Myxococcales bacterium]|nr:hypothetical protein [Myxococcales bacterium]
MGRLGWSPVVVLLLACGPVVGNTGSDGGETAGSSSDGGGSSPTPTTNGEVSTDPTQDPTQATTIDPDPTIDPDTGSSSSDTATTAIFIDTDTSCFAHCTYECDLWTQDGCADGDKCMPWANDGGSAWNAKRCSPVAENPGQPGDPCTVEGSGVSGIDSCDVGVMCWNVDAETNTGTCVAMCTGSEADPSCAGACDRCMIANDAVLILCLPLCHPAGDDCGDDEVCAVIDEVFQCVPAFVSGGVGLGDACASASDCSPGLSCVGAAELPACDGDACCTPLCDPGDAEGCAEVPGTACVELIAGVDGCTAAVGSCVLPG